jgi:hypothetical protein
MKNARSQKAGTSAGQRNYNPSALLFPELEPPVVAAYYPTPGTRADEALQAMMTGPQNQADYWQGWRLGASVTQ